MEVEQQAISVEMTNVRRPGRCIMEKPGEVRAVQTGWEELYALSRKRQWPAL